VRQFTFMLPGFVPQSEFDAIADANLVVNETQVVSNDMCANPKFLGDLSIFQTLGDKRNDSSLTLAQLSRAIEQSLLSWQFPPWGKPGERSAQSLRGCATSKP
jgi:hypothetical protein